MQRVSSLTKYFEEGYDAGHIFSHPEYVFVEENWGFLHRWTKITVWADVLDLRQGSDEQGEVYYHYTSHLAYSNITNESKEAVELWASLNTEEGKSRNAYWGKGIYTVPKSPDQWAAPPEEPSWTPVHRLLDNNYRSMMKRDLADPNRGREYVDREYPGRAQFCIPILVNSWMAYDVSKERTPEMVTRGKPPGTNLADGKLNEEGKPHRVCVVIRKQSREEREGAPKLRRPPGRGSRRGSIVHHLHARGDLLQRVRARLMALEKASSQEAILEKVRAQYRLAKVYSDLGKNREAMELLMQVVQHRRKPSEISPDAARAITQLAKVLQRMGYFREAFETQIQVLRGLNLKRQTTGEIQHLDCLSHIGQIYMDQQMMAEAEPPLVEAYSGRYVLLGPNHFDTLHSVQDLAAVFDYLLKHQEAIKFSRLALEGMSQQLGASHPSCLDCKLRLAERLAHFKSWEEAMTLYEGTSEKQNADGICKEMSKQLGPVHPKTQAAAVSHIMALCHHGRFVKAVRLWRERVRLTGFMDNVLLFMDLTFQYASYQGMMGMLLLMYLGLLAIMPGLPFLRMAELVQFNWMFCLLPLWVLQSAHFVAVARLGCPSAKAKEGAESAAAAKGRQLDIDSVAVNLAVICSSFLLVLRLDSFHVPAFFVGMPWLLLELWMLQWWRLDCLCPTWHAVLRVLTVLALCFWADEYLPWELRILSIGPPLLITCISLVLLVRGLIRRGAMSPLVSVIATMRSQELRYHVLRVFQSLLFTVTLLVFLFPSEDNAQVAVTLLPLFGLALMPLVAFVTLKLRLLLHRPIRSSGVREFLRSTRPTLPKSLTRPTLPKSLTFHSS